MTIQLTNAHPKQKWLQLLRTKYRTNHLLHRKWNPKGSWKNWSDKAFTSMIRTFKIKSLRNWIKNKLHQEWNHCTAKVSRVLSIRHLQSWLQESKSMTCLTPQRLLLIYRNLFSESLRVKYFLKTFRGKISSKFHDLKKTFSKHRSKISETTCSYKLIERSFMDAMPYFHSEKNWVL